MATQNVENRLVPSLTGGALALAEHIAYSTKQEGSGYLQREVIDKSLKLKIDEIAALGASAMYDENTTVVEKLLELVDNAHYASESADEAEQYALRAEAAQQDILSRQNAINQTATNTVNAIETKKQEVISQFTDQITKIQNIENAVNEFRDSFDADRQFQIMTESDYNSLLSKDPGTIYFLW